VLGLLAAAIGICVCSCGGGGKPKLRIAVVPKGTTHEFWEAIHAGAVKAERELNAEGVPVEIVWRGPLKEDDRDQQIQVVENFSAGNADGIVLAPLDNNALVGPVESAMDSGVPVVIIDSGLNTERYVSFIATDNRRGGSLAGEKLAELLGGSGQVILVRYQVGSASTMEREEGFLEAIGKFSGIELISSDQYSGATRESAYQTCENLLRRFGQEVDGVFCPNETVTVTMVKALRDIGRAAGTVQVVGFDTGRQSIEDLRLGDLQGLVVQNPVRMGYEGVRKVVAHLRGEKVDKRIDTGVTLAVPEDLDDPALQELLDPPIDRYLKRSTNP
jgi:ribose transport system substrate-binding protein